MKKILMAVVMMGMTGAAYAADFGALAVMTAAGLKASVPADGVAVEPAISKSDVNMQLAPAALYKSKCEPVFPNPELTKVEFIIPAFGDRIAMFYREVERSGVHYTFGDTQYSGFIFYGAMADYTVAIPKSVLKYQEVGMRFQVAFSDEERGDFRLICTVTDRLL